MTDSYSERKALLEEFRQVTESMSAALDLEKDEVFLDLLDQREELIRQLDENARDMPPGASTEGEFREIAAELLDMDHEVSRKLNARISEMRGQMIDYRTELSSLRNLKKLAKGYSITVQDDKGYFVDKKK